MDEIKNWQPLNRYFNDCQRPRRLSFCKCRTNMRWPRRRGEGHRIYGLCLLPTNDEKGVVRRMTREVLLLIAASLSSFGMGMGVCSIIYQIALRGEHVYKRDDQTTKPKQGGSDSNR